MPTWNEIKSDRSHLDIFKLRQNVISAIRQFFNKNGFLETFTPILQPAVIPESYLDIFSTELINMNGEKEKRFLIPSPEVSIKKLLAAGVDKCFEITKCFRNRETDSNLHNYEFMMLEWYRSNANYMDILKDYQKLFFSVLAATNKDLQNFEYRDYKIDLSNPWEKLSVADALKKYSNVEFDEITDKKNFKNQFPVEKIAKAAIKKGYKVQNNNTWEELFNQIYLNEIGIHLGTHGKPTIIYDYPSPVAALAKLKNNDNRIAERFEVYIGGLEMADCCTELTDYEEQKQRFSASEKEILKSNKNKIDVDYEFLAALKSGLGDCSGIAMGVDRLIMLLADKRDIKETILTFS